MPAEMVGDGGQLLLVAEYPGREEDLDGRPMRGVSGSYLRKLLKDWGVTNYVLDNALKCYVGKTKVKPTYITACRAYGAEVARQTQPKRIVCLGGTALASVLGRRPAVLSIRKGWSWHRTDAGVIPVFFTMNPAVATRNRFMRAAFEADLKWALFAPPPVPKFDGVVFVIENAEDAREAEEDLRRYVWASYDVETHGQMHDRDFRIECVTFAPTGKKHAWAVNRAAMRDPEVRAVVKLMVEQLDLVTANGKYDDRSMLLDLDASAKESYADVRLMSRMLDPQAAAKLEVIAERVGMGGHKEDMKSEVSKVCRELKRQASPPAPLTPKGNKRKVKEDLFVIPPEVLAKIRAGADPHAYAFGYTAEDLTLVYNARDAVVTREYAERVLPEFRSNPQTSREWNEVMRGVNSAVRMIEYWGIRVDRAAIDQFAAYCKDKIVESRRALTAIAGPDFNPNSTAQVRTLLFDKLGLPKVKFTDSGADSTDHEVLEELAGNTTVDALLSHRKWTKLDGTYATGMIPHVREDGRIHPSMLPDGTGTARLSCADPNLYNIPRSKGAPEAAMSRNCFVATDGCVLLETDQAQVEIRVAALLSGDDVLAQDFRDGIDIHTLNATACCEVAFGIPRAKWDTMSKQERDPYRSRAKSITFGKLYGKTDAGFAAELGVPVAEIAKINRIIWGRYRRLNEWTEEIRRKGTREGGVWTYWRGEKARWRPLWGVADPDEAIRKNAVNACCNTPVQGTAAYYTSASLWPICEWIRREKFPAKLVLTVYDSIMLDVDKRFVAEAAGKVREVMLSHWSGNVPLDVDQQVGVAWGSLEKYKQPVSKHEERAIMGV